MEVERLIEDMRSRRNEENIGPMEAYMRNQFAFLGIRAAERKEASRDFFREERKKKSLDWNLVERLWQEEEREFQYLAIDYIKAREAYLKEEDFFKIRDYIVRKSWWDTVDNFNRPLGQIVRANPSLKEEILAWSRDENLWLRRMSIIHQLSLKEETDEKILDLTIKNNLASQEFFINKAIGWALREYSKSSRAWVVDFIEENRDSLDSLSIREAEKYI